MTQRLNGPTHDVSFGNLNDERRDAGPNPVLGVQATFEDDAWIISVVGPAGRWKMPKTAANDLAHALLAALGDCARFELESSRTAGEAGESPP